MNTTLAQPFGRHFGAVDAIVCDAIRNQVISAARDGKIIAWGLGNGVTKVLHTLPPSQRQESFHRLALQGNLLIAGSSREMVLMIDLETGAKSMQEMMEFAISDVAISSQGLIAVVGDSDSLKLLDGGLNLIWEGSTYKYPYSACFSSNGRKWLIASWNGNIYEEEVEQLKPMKFHEEEGIYFGSVLEELGASFPCCPAFDAMYCAGGKIVVAGEQPIAPGGGHLCVWDPLTESFVYQFPSRHGIHRLAVSTDGKWLAAGGNDQIVWLWRVEGFSLVAQWELGNTQFEESKLSYDEEFALRLRRAGINVEGFQGANPPEIPGDTYYPASLEYYTATGRGAVFSLAFGAPDTRVLYAGTQGGDILELRF